MQTLNVLPQIRHNYCRVFPALQSRPSAKTGAEADGRSNARVAPARGHRLPRATGAAKGLQPCRGHRATAGARATQGPNHPRPTRAQPAPKPASGDTAEQPPRPGTAAPAQALPAAALLPQAVAFREEAPVRGAASPPTPVFAPGPACASPPPAPPPPRAGGCCRAR